MSVIDSFRRPAADGLKIRISEGEFEVIQDWKALPSGSGVKFDNLPCRPVLVEVGELVPAPRTLVPQMHRFGAAFVELPQADRYPLTVSVPALTRVEFRVADIAGRAVPGGFVTVVPRTGGRVTPRAGGVALALDASGQGSVLLERGRYAAGLGGGARVVASDVRGRVAGPEPEFEVGGEPLVVRLRAENNVPVSGTVRDHEGRALPGVRVIARTLDGRDIAETVSDASGAFHASVGALPVITAARDESGTWVFEPEDARADKADEASRIAFSARRYEGPRFRARITGEDGRPIAHVDVFATVCSGGPARRSYRVETGQDGRIEIPCVPECDVEVRVQPPRGEPFFDREWRGGPDACRAEQGIALAAGATVRGRVADEDGQPVPGIPIALQAGARVLQPADTREDGSFTMAPVPPGTYRVVVAPNSPSGFRGLVLHRAPVRKNEPPAPAEVSIAAAASAISFDVLAVRGAQVCLGAVNDGGEPVPVRSLRVFAGRSEEPVASAAPAAGGRERTDRLCSPGLPPGDYYVLVEAGAGAYGPAWWPGVAAREKAVPLRLPEGRRVEVRPVRLGRPTID